jgi:Zn-finger nucleic acid-binding protein
MECPNCKAAMTSMVLDARISRAPMTIDICTDCQAFWFDLFESLQLSPASTLKLIKLIGEQATKQKSPYREDMRCPRCSLALKLTHDMQRNTRFAYWRCEEHGRFTSFFDFLREKNFIRVLSPQEIEQLRQNIQTVNCQNCGAAIDLNAAAVCSHCGSPVSMLDMKQPQELLAQLQQAAAPKPVDPELMLKLARAKDEVESSFRTQKLDKVEWGGDSSTSLVDAGLSAVARWLTKSGK